MLSRLTAIACAVVLLASTGTAAYLQGTRSAGADPAGSGRVNADLVDEVLGQISNSAADPPDPRVLVDGAVDGVLKALDDPYAQYYDEREFSDFNAVLEGEFSGVGLLLEEKPNGLTVVNVLPDTPAERAGISAGERIVSVDGTDVRNRPISAVVELVKGEEGTEVMLGLTGGRRGRYEVTLRRERIEAPNVDARMLDDGNGYVGLLQFSSGAGERVRAAVDELLADGADGIVLDLRGNPGGLLPEAIAVASVFIEDGAVVSVQERNAERRLYSAQGDALGDVPLVVVVDRGSASASEIVAGAIQDAGRGTIVGTRTFGKGTVQTISDLDSGGGIKFTTAEYFTPSGDSIEGVGVRPDRRVQGDDEQLAAAQDELRSLVAAVQ